MALKKQKKLDKIEIVMTDEGYPVVQIREATTVYDSTANTRIGGKEFHRTVVMPDADFSQESPEVQAVAAMLFTDEVKAAYAAKLAADAPVV